MFIQVGIRLRITDHYNFSQNNHLYLPFEWHLGWSLPCSAGTLRPVLHWRTLCPSSCLSWKGPKSTEQSLVWTRGGGRRAGNSSLDLCGIWQWRPAGHGRRDSPGSPVGGAAGHIVRLEDTYHANYYLKQFVYVLLRYLRKHSTALGFLEVTIGLSNDVVLLLSTQ